jgi:hypothetical protein
MRFKTDRKKNQKNLKMYFMLKNKKRKVNTEEVKVVKNGTELSKKIRNMRIKIDKVFEISLNIIKLIKFDK